MGKNPPPPTCRCLPVLFFTAGIISIFCFCFFFFVVVVTTRIATLCLFAVLAAAAAVAITTFIAPIAWPWPWPCAVSLGHQKLVKVGSEALDRVSVQAGLVCHRRQPALCLSSQARLARVQIWGARPGPSAPPARCGG